MDKHNIMWIFKLRHKKTLYKLSSHIRKKTIEIKLGLQMGGFKNKWMAMSGAITLPQRYAGLHLWHHPWAYSKDHSNTSQHTDQSASREGKAEQSRTNQSLSEESSRFLLAILNTLHKDHSHTSTKNLSA